MVSPPTSLPSPAPSSSSSRHPHPSFSSLPPPRTGSTNGYPDPPIAQGYPAPSRPGMYYPFAPEYDDSTPLTGSAPFDQPYPGPQPPGATYRQLPHTAAFLPTVSSSPPPHVPQYVPPPQHQLPPDPIHSALSASGMGMAPGAGPNGWGWRPASVQNGAQGQGQFPLYRAPNGAEYPSSRAGSQPGSAGGRERRRRERDEDGHRDRDRDKDGEDEVITTIFVVGFPDDMLEREFQNIFTFAPGFEAATLKFPSGRSREPTAALLAELTQLASLREARSREPSGGSAEEDAALLQQQQAGLEEALAALQMASTTANTSTSTTPSAPVSLTPSAPSGPVLSHGGVPPRRQTIGFARFKTRPDALAAREQLQGRKIDYMTGATLKAEMAKKNLHTKRTTSGEELVGMLLRSGRLAGLVQQYTGGRADRPDAREPPTYAQAPGGVGAAPGGIGASAREAWDSWTLPHPAQVQPPPQPGQIPAPSSDNANGGYPYPVHPSQQPKAYGTGNPLQPVSSRSSVASNTTSPPLSSRSPLQRSAGAVPISTVTGDSKALLALAEETDELELDMEWSARNPGSMDFTPRRSDRQDPLRSSLSQQQYPYAFAPQGFGIGQGAQRVEFGTSPTSTNDALSETGRSMGNPADQNPPINTLYVGNLPAISPPTHPPNFLEESLRALFQRSPGFKRMSFRQKINGPMCFVEFEDTGYASLAIKEMYGHNLNGLVKGGIRLSYSKNSLGQRGQSHSSINSGMYGGIAHTVALAGMSPAVPASAPAPGGAQSFSSLGLSQSPPPPPPPTATLSPTAQPFTIPSLSTSMSPRSRYFASPPGTNSSSEPRSPSFTPFTPSSASSHGHSHSISINGHPAAPGGIGNGIELATSPIKTPASFSWVSTSTGSVGNGYGHTHPHGHGLDGFPSSLGGVASTWGSSSATGSGSRGSG